MVFGLPTIRFVSVSSAKYNKGFSETGSYGTAKPKTYILTLLIKTWSKVYAYVSQFSMLRFSVFAATLWVSLEYLRAHFLTGFPWLLLGMSQWKFTSLIQISEFTGVYGVSFLIIIINVSLARLIRTKKIASFILLIAAVACVTAVSYIIRLRNDVSSPPYMTVAVLQGNIDQYKKWDNAYESEHYAYLHRPGA